MIGEARAHSIVRRFLTHIGVTNREELKDMKPSCCGYTERIDVGGKSIPIMVTLGPYCGGKKLKPDEIGIDALGKNEYSAAIKFRDLDPKPRRKRKKQFDK